MGSFVRLIAGCVIGGAVAVALSAGCGDIDVSGLGPSPGVDGSSEPDVLNPSHDGDTREGSVATCLDHVLDGDESDVDCGGSCPTKCNTGQGCRTGDDCTTRSCIGGTCAAASCSDGVQNGTETDVDCGGSCTTKCADNKHCAAGGDCASGVCTGGTCQAPTCSDGVKNGQETDVDCGGPACGKCDVKKSCNGDSDCLSGYCSPAAKQCAAPTCSDGVKDGQETDVDCGGPACPACGDNKSCLVQTDCVAADYCNASKKCQPKATNGNACAQDLQCASGNCVDGVCCNVAAASCGGCRACNVAGSAGTCTNVPAGQDPHNACTANVANCKSGKCAGDGTCNAANGTSCGSSTCSGASETDAVCSGGACTHPQKACSPYVCGGNACAAACSGDSQCAAGFFCAKNNTCQPQVAQGGACDLANDCKQAGCRQCASAGGCVDGVCCDTACGGACDACSVAAGAATNGTCANVAAGSAGNPACSPYVCSGGAPTCPTTCNGDSDCANGFYCDAAGVCAAQKTLGASCNTTTDCKQPGCRECTLACALGVCT